MNDSEAQSSILGSAGRGYKFTLTATVEAPGGPRSAYAVIELEVNSPPSGGGMTASLTQACEA